MTVGELIQILQKYPQDKIVEIGDTLNDYGEASRVVEFEKYLEIQSDKDNNY